MALAFLAILLPAAGQATAATNLAVFNFQLKTGQEDWVWLEKFMSDQMATDLVQDRSLSVVARDRMQLLADKMKWTAEKLRQLPPFEFENWAVIALGGVPNKAQVGDMGIDGQIYPLSALPKKTGEAAGELAFMDAWYPIQVKQKDKVGRPDIDAFEAVLMRESRTVGFFVAFDYSSDAMDEIGAFFRRSGIMIRALTVKDILDGDIGRKLA